MVAFAVLVIAPIIIVGTITIRQTSIVLEHQAEKAQSELANRVSDEFGNYIERHCNIMAQLIRVRGLASSDAETEPETPLRNPGLRAQL